MLNLIEFEICVASSMNRLPVCCCYSLEFLFVSRMSGMGCVQFYDGLCGRCKPVDVVQKFVTFLPFVIKPHQHIRTI